jgi:hypothetical protein
MKYFVIRQKSTGYIFPTRRGASSKADFHKQNIPRLFKTKAHAESCLKNWKSGIQYIRRYTNHWGEYDETWEEKEIPERKTDDYEVICVDLRGL